MAARVNLDGNYNAKDSNVGGKFRTQYQRARALTNAGREKEAERALSFARNATKLAKKRRQK